MPSGSKKVLIVDDEEILTWIMSKTLSKDRKKYEILVANDGDKALEIMESVPVDLVITDIRMPGMSGLDLLERIREGHPQTKVIIMTAYGNPEVQKEANERGCLHYLEKPFKIEDLRNLILESIKVSKKGFVGQVADLQLTDIIQLNCLGKMQTALSVSKEDQEGMVYFKDGEIVHADCGGRSGEEALYTILGWDGGDFTTISGAEPPHISIQRPWQELLIEAMRRKDEGQSAIEGSGEAVNLVETDERELEEPADFEREASTRDWEALRASPGADIPQEGAGLPRRKATSVVERIPKEDIREPGAPKAPSARDKSAAIGRILVEWQQSTEEIQGAAVVTVDGLNLASHVSRGRIPADQLAALTASLFKVGSKSVKVLHRGPMQELYLKGAQGTIHLYGIDSKTILSVLAGPDANIGMVHIESRERCKRIAQVLSSRAGS